MVGAAVSKAVLDSDTNYLIDPIRVFLRHLSEEEARYFLAPISRHRQQGRAYLKLYRRSLQDTFKCYPSSCLWPIFRSRCLKHGNGGTLRNDNFPFEPYFEGLWLGDGNKKTPVHPPLSMTPPCRRSLIRVLSKINDSGPLRWVSLSLAFRSAFIQLVLT